MKTWFMLTLVGQDRPGIVAAVSQALFEENCNLGEASMVRLGGNFSIMMMVQTGGGREALRDRVTAVAGPMGLTVHVDAIEGRLHQHVEPNLRISVYGADRPGIIAEVTKALGDVGFNIVDLESDVGGTGGKPIFIMHIEGVAPGGMEAVEAVLKELRKKNVEIHVAPLDTLMG
ncbi:MAG: glycine cleavage system protein R [Nitrospinaceae bacterium]